MADSGNNLAVEKNISEKVIRHLPVPAFAIDKDHNIICWNAALEGYTGISSEKMIGTGDAWKVFFNEKKLMLADLLLDYKPGDPGLSSYKHLSPGISGLEEIRAFRNKNGGVIWFRMRAVPLMGEDNEILGAIQVFEDITSLKQAETNLTDNCKLCSESLREKEILLKEVHHRVKNNLQIIISILKLHSYNTTDQELKNVLQECYNQVYSMSMLHEKMYRSDNISDVNAGEYISSLATYLIEDLFAKGGDVRLLTDIDPAINLSLDKGTHLSLMLNEMTTNSMKYAFKEKDSGQISISLNNDNLGNYRLVYADNGCGLPEDFRIEDSDSLGFELITNLAEQLGGKLEIENDGGLKYILLFPAD